MDIQEKHAQAAKQDFFRLQEYVAHVQLLAYIALIALLRLHVIHVVQTISAQPVITAIQDTSKILIKLAMFVLT
jgi:hypothetical protein